jgi:transglutaminase-like putative cysteine protease
LIYSVLHITTFTYQPAVRESVMEVRLQPRSDGPQHCLTFELDVAPAANIMQYRDFMGNTVHHFDIAGKHSEVKVTARSSVDVVPVAPPNSADAGSWDDLDRAIASGSEDYWEMLLPSQFAKSSASLEALAHDLRCQRRDTPLQLLTELNQAIYESFAYVPNSTNVDSPIDHALHSRQGVCQDFAHIMLALVRPLKIPCRYVSGYMFHRHNEDAEEKKDRSLEGASHAWIEAVIPNLGWIAFDPTNNLIGADRHIRVALGRDYADVPPTRGVHKGEAQSALSVAVTVSPSDAPPPLQLPPTLIIQSRPLNPRSNRIDHEQQQQQQ